MKNLLLIGGTMGVGKTTTGQILKRKLSNAVYLDGDWCWDADPFIVNDETRKMVMNNITHLLNNFIACSAYENVVFTWVMHEQSIIDDILFHLDTKNACVYSFSLVSEKEALIKRLNADIAKGVRKEDIIERSVIRLPLYEKLNTIRIDTTYKNPDEAADEIISRMIL